MHNHFQLTTVIQCFDIIWVHMADHSHDDHCDYCHQYRTKTHYNFLVQNSVATASERGEIILFEKDVKNANQPSSDEQNMKHLQQNKII